MYSSWVLEPTFDKRRKAPDSYWWRLNWIMLHLSVLHQDAWTELKRPWSSNAPLQDAWTELKRPWSSNALSSSFICQLSRVYTTLAIKLPLLNNMLLFYLPTLPVRTLCTSEKLIYFMHKRLLILDKGEIEKVSRNNFQPTGVLMMSSRGIYYSNLLRQNWTLWSILRCK